MLLLQHNLVIDVCLPVHPSVNHTLVLTQNYWLYDLAVFTSPGWFWFLETKFCMLDHRNYPLQGFQMRLECVKMAKKTDFWAIHHY